MNSLVDLYRHHEGKASDKWSLYLDLYEKLFSDIRQKNVRLLEVGIQNGGSLEIWAKYFDHAEIILGCDINQDCQNLRFTDQKINLLIGDINSNQVLKSISQMSKEYDIIIDDGSHTSPDIIKTFSSLFPLLSDGGIYVVEDIHCSYWKSFGGGLYDPYSSISFFKRIVDVVNYCNWGISKSRQNLLCGFIERYQLVISELLLSEIASVEFVDSVCVLRKKKNISKFLGMRIVVGKEEQVMPGNLEFDKSYLKAPDQAFNAWSTLSASPDEVYLSITKNNQDLLAELNLARTALQIKDGQIEEIYQSSSWILTRPFRFMASLLAKIKKRIST